MRRPSSTRGRAVVVLALLVANLLAVATPALGGFTVPAASEPTIDLDVLGTTTLGTPTNLACSYTASTTINVTWTEAAAPADGHSISRRVNAGAYTDDFATTSPRTTVTYSDANLSTLNTYTYQLRSKVGLWRGNGYTELASTGCTGIVGTPTSSANTTKLSDPEGIALDSTGTYLYVADTANHRIRKIDLAANTITTIAGDGETGDDGVGNPATGKNLSSPEAVFVTGSAAAATDTVWIADTGHHRIRKLTNNGGCSATPMACVYTSAEVAGTGASGSTPETGDATSAKFDNPAGIVVGPGSNPSIYIADRGNNKIKRLFWDTTPTDGYDIEVVAGGAASALDETPCVPVGDCTFNAPEGMAIEADGDMYVADRVNRKIRKISPGGCGGAVNSTGTCGVTTITGTGTASFSGDGGAATSATLNAPESVGVEPDCSSNCDIFVGDRDNSRVRKVFWDAVDARNEITTVAGTGTSAYSGEGYPAVNSSVHTPRGVAVTASGIVYVADTGHDMIRKITADTAVIFNQATARLVATAGNGTGGFADGPEAATAAVRTPEGVVVDANGYVWFADSADNRIRVILPTGTVATVAGTGSSGNSGDNGSALSASLSGPTGIAVSTGGDLYIADAGNNRVRKVASSTGDIAAYAGTGTNCTGTNCAETGNATSTRLSGPTDVVLDSSGNLFISDTGTHTIRKVDTQATPQVSTFAGLLVTPTYTDGTGSTARFSFPAGLAIDSSNNLFLADRGNARIRKITSGAEVTTIAGGGAFEVDGNNCDGLRPPTGAGPVWIGSVYDVAVNSATGDVFYPQTFDYRVCKIAAGTGNPTSAMGTGSSGSTGDGGAPASAQIELSRGITMTTTGLMYLSHSVATGRIRSVQNP